MSDVKSECLPWQFSSDVNQASLIYHAPSGRPRRNMQRHKFRTSTIRKTCPACLPRQCNSLLPTLFRSLNLCLGSIVRKEGKSLKIGPRIQPCEYNSSRTLSVHCFENMNSSTVSWKDTDISPLSKCSKCLNL